MGTLLNTPFRSACRGWEVHNETDRNVVMPKAKGSKADPNAEYALATAEEVEKMAAQLETVKAQQRADREAAEDAQKAAREAAFAARPPVKPDNRDWDRFKNQLQRANAQAEKEYAKSSDGVEDLREKKKSLNESA